MTDKLVDITKQYVKNLLPKRDLNSNKGSFGKVLNVAGCANYQGAAYLSSLAPLKVGAGLVTLASIDSVINNLASNAPWITFFSLKDEDKNFIAADAFIGLKPVIDNYNVISIGPGLSDSISVCSFVEDILDYLSDADKNVVLDADALNIISKLGVKKVPRNSIMTPHPMELSRLLGVSVDVIQADRIKYAMIASEKFNCVVVLKGQGSIISLPNGKVFKNTTGNSALAKAGSGDVLTGIISGFLAQGVHLSEAVLLAVYLHGLCGELAAKDLTEYSVLATDQIEYIPTALRHIMEVSS